MRLDTVVCAGLLIGAGMGIEYLYHPVANQLNPTRTVSKFELTEGDKNLLQLKSLSMMRVDYNSDVAPQTTKSFLGVPTGWSQVPMKVTANVTIGLELDHYKVNPLIGEPGTVDLELSEPQVESISTDFLSLYSKDKNVQVVRGFLGFGSDNEAQLVRDGLLMGSLSGLVRVCRDEGELRQKAKDQAIEIWTSLLQNHGVKVRDVTFRPRPWIKTGDDGVPLDCGQGQQLLQELRNKK